MALFSLQDVVNVVGGIGVLLPLLKQVCEAEQVYNGGQEISDLLGPELTSSRGPGALLLPLNKSSGQFICSSSSMKTLHTCETITITSFPVMSVNVTNNKSDLNAVYVHTVF